jgi:hypothetical protein
MNYNDVFEMRFSDVAKVVGFIALVCGVLTIAFR